MLTTRIRHLDANIKEISLDVLPADKALELLTKLLGRNRVQQQGEAALQLCEWLGYLPLGVELVGRYLLQQPDLSLAEMLQRLNSKKLEDEALQNPTLSLSTAELGIKAAFELSWQQLDSKTQQVGMFLSLFAQAIIPWQLVENAASKEVSLLGNQTEISTAKNQLFKRHLIQKVETTIL